MEALFIVLGIVIVLLAYRKFGRKNIFTKEEKYYTIDDQYNAERRNREIEIDSLLTKMGKNGVNDLSEKDRKRLEELSKK
ncbi:DUF6576 domain-containing protein [Chryseobacterium sp. HSC-36S06]|uniref:DUF6576 domain-containing protein n=1 Tax=Chryseobacterium sp. HSC-36S06 TaxID=2910970 RepID=UPI001B3EF637|nr:DUF6576 domain-containing protein [Chryseobacterium sp. HSC-36S06]MBP3839989.1 rhomboid family protein [Chryseobacterium sp.]MCP2037476.1 DNA-binding transcriptional regulator GbsR (MarR family) [Chryseobacterium sp. HSC-36S06]